MAGDCDIYIRNDGWFYSYLYIDSETMINIDFEEVFDSLARDLNEGFCINCGCSSMGVEPDAKEYRCDACGGFTLYGAEVLLLLMDGEVDF